MEEMLKNASRSSRSRKLNTIMEIVETPDENGNLTVDPNTKKGDTCKTTSTSSQTQGNPSSYPTTDLLNTAIYRSPSERRMAFTHASPRHTLSTEPSYWRERANVAISPAGVIRSSSEHSSLRPTCGQNISEVEFFFPEFFENGETLRTGKRAEALCKELEQKKSMQNEVSSKEDPLVQSWLSLFGSQDGLSIKWNESTRKYWLSPSTRIKCRINRNQQNRLFSRWRRKIILQLFQRFCIL